MLYSRNALYISDEEQNKIRNTKILAAGCGIGSNIAECALRLGFENITIVDGDQVEPSNRNRQNYITDDDETQKVFALEKRLKRINQGATIKVYNEFISSANVNDILKNIDIAINALDFSSDIPFLFDELCQAKNIPVLHPYNFGWGALVFVVLPNGQRLSDISQNFQGFEKKVASFLIKRVDSENRKWISQILEKFENTPNIQPPQLSVGSWLAAGACSNILNNLATNKPVKSFPDYYFLSANR